MVRTVKILIVLIQHLHLLRTLGVNRVGSMWTMEYNRKLKKPDKPGRQWCLVFTCGHKARQTVLELAHEINE